MHRYVCISNAVKRYTGIVRWVKLLDVYSGKRTRAVIINVFLFSHVPAVRFTPAWRSRRRRKWRTGGAWDPHGTVLSGLGRVQVKVTRWLKHATITHKQRRLKCCPDKEAKPLYNSLIFVTQNGNSQFPAENFVLIRCSKKNTKNV